MAAVQPKEEKSPPKEVPLNKACEPCRALKVRCLPATDGANATCQRCIKFNRVCVYAPPHRKKQRKRTDARVSELEKEILAMRNLLDRKNRNSVQPHGHSAQTAQHDLPPLVLANRMTHPFDHGIKMEVAFGHEPDIVDRGLITMADARQLLAHFTTTSLRHLPLVTLRHRQTADELRSTHPILFKAIMTTAAAALRPTLFTQLSTEIIKEYVQRVMINGEKTLELVQAISITSAWYHPTDKYATLKFYEYITLASTMALDIGLGDRPTRTDTMEPQILRNRKRTLVACFTHSCVTAFIIRRPNTLPLSTYMEEIIYELDTSPTSTDTDRLLAAFASLFRLADEISKTFSLTDAGREGRYDEDYIHQNIIIYQQKLLQWKEHYNIDNTSVQLQYLYHMVVMVLHELPLHLAYPTAWFRAPHFLGCPRDPDPSFSLLATQYLPVACASAQAMINIFTSRPTVSLRAGPNYMYAGLLLALVTLSAIALLPAAPDYALTGCLEFYSDVTQAERLLDASINKIVDAAGRMEYRIPSMFAISLTRLRKWLQWMLLQRRLDPNVKDLPLFSLFAGPEDHPCLLSQDPLELEDVRSSSREHSEGSAHVASPLSRTDTNSSATNPAYVPLPRDEFSVEGNYDDLDFGWNAALEQDYSTVLDPNLFDMDMRLLDMAGTMALENGYVPDLTAIPTGMPGGPMPGVL